MLHVISHGPASEDPLPHAGKGEIAQILARAGLQLGVTTVGRILKEKPPHQPTAAQAAEAPQRVVTSKYPNHAWLADLTTSPSALVSGPHGCLLPAAMLAFLLVDWRGDGSLFPPHPGNHVLLAGAEFASHACLPGPAMQAANTGPRHLITDRGPQFDCHKYKLWRRGKRIKPRFGALGQHGSIAVTERLILTLKQNLAWLPLIPLRRRVFRRQLLELVAWYNGHRPHMSLNGRTPEDVYCRQRLANRQPRFEPRPRRPRPSPCAQPVTLVKGRPGVGLEMEVIFHGNCCVKVESRLGRAMLVNSAEAFQLRKV